MIWARKQLKGRALSVAFFCLGFAAHAQDPYPRLDALAFYKAIDQVEEPYRSVFQVQCVSMAADYCEAKVSGPMLACLADLEGALVEYVDAQLPLLPDKIDGGGLLAHSYARQVKNLRSGVAPTETCVHAIALDRQVCRIVKANTRMSSLHSLAVRAGVSLP